MAQNGTVCHIVLLCPDVAVHCCSGALVQWCTGAVVPCSRIPGWRPVDSRSAKLNKCLCQSLLQASA